MLKNNVFHYDKSAVIEVDATKDGLFVSCSILTKCTYKSILEHIQQDFEKRARYGHDVTRRDRDHDGKVSEHSDWMSSDLARCDWFTIMMTFLKVPLTLKGIAA